MMGSGECGENSEETERETDWTVRHIHIINNITRSI